jgi:hypothetical protein
MGGTRNHWAEAQRCHLTAGIREEPQCIEPFPPPESVAQFFGTVHPEWLVEIFEMIRPGHLVWISAMVQLESSVQTCEEVCL